VPPPHNPLQKWSTYNSASLLLRFNPTGETTKYPKLFGNLASKSLCLFRNSLGLTKTARAPLGRCTSVEMSKIDYSIGNWLGLFVMIVRTKVVRQTPNVSAISTIGETKS
jgi:hypothetical protein